VDQLYLNIVRRWWWLLIVAPLVAAVTAFLVVRQQPQMYEASSRMCVGPCVDALSPDLNDLRAAAQLMQTYAEFATTRPVLEEVVKQATLSLSPDKLDSKLKINVDKEALILTIHVEDTEPERTVTIANTLAEVLRGLSPSGGESLPAVIYGQIRNQADELERTIQEIEGRISRLQIELNDATSAQEQTAYLDQLNQERASLETARSTLAILYNSLLTTPTNQVKIIESATTGTPIPQRLSLIAITAALAGLVFAIVVAFGFEYLDESLKTADELGKLGLVSVLGTVSVDDRGDSDTQDMSLALQLRMKTAAAEDYRMLGTKLPVASEAQGLSSLIISSVDETGDAGEIATYLAVVLSQTGKRVILVDANLRNPTIGKLLGIGGRLGLTHVLGGQSKVPELTAIHWAPGLSALPSGPATEDAFSQLASPQMTTLLNQLEGQADVVLIALPPLLSYAESLLLASRTDGAILLVHSGKSRHNTVESAVANLNAVGARAVGAVMVDKSSLPPLHQLTMATRRLPRIPGESEEASDSGRSFPRPNFGKLSEYLQRIRHWMSVPEWRYRLRLSKPDSGRRS
jgi:capsular polysaccharide biosynthesis protein/Mrp family chromosome partitioning ATPase